MGEMADLIASDEWEVAGPEDKDIEMVDCGHFIPSGKLFYWNQRTCRSVCDKCVPKNAVVGGKQ